MLSTYTMKIKFAEVILLVILPKIVNGSTETDCWTDGCNSEYPHPCDFLPSRCIAFSSICNGVFDCVDQSDELNCISTNTIEENSCVMPIQETGHGRISEYKLQLLEAHNYFRCMHGVPPLIWDTVLSEAARVYGNVTLKQESTALFLDQYWPFGKNTAMYLQDYFPTVTGMETVDCWYQHKQFYNCDDPKPSVLTDMFTQVIWKDTTRVGCGIAEGQEVYVVCNYFPKGNVNGTFIENVPCVKNSTMTEY
ncbi:Golgi-associated plant pathogenesis-related protein 1-like [Saccoglossus kowalevskii]